ncbi:MAG: Hpt domain-containing protein [Polyangiaceae bacterium]
MGSPSLHASTGGSSAPCIVLVALDEADTRSLRACVGDGTFTTRSVDDVTSLAPYAGVLEVFVVPCPASPHAPDLGVKGGHDDALAYVLAAVDGRVVLALVDAFAPGAIEAAIEAGADDVLVRGTDDPAAFARTVRVALARWTRAHPEKVRDVVGRGMPRCVDPAPPTTSPVVRAVGEAFPGDILAKVDADVRRLLPKFVANRRADVVELGLCIARADWPRATRIGHNMKGTGAAYGLSPISDLGARLEIAAREGLLAAVREIVAELGDYLGRVELAMTASPLPSLLGVDAKDLSEPDSRFSRGRSGTYARTRPEEDGEAEESDREKPPSDRRDGSGGRR